MSHQVRFVSWGEFWFNTAVGTLSSGTAAVIQDFLNGVFSTGIPVIDRIRLRQTTDLSITVDYIGKNRYLSLKKGSNSTTGTFTFDYLFKENPSSGITRIGFRTKRADTTLSNCSPILINGKISIDGTHYTQLTTGQSSAKETYHEIEINWADKVINVFINDKSTSVIINFTQLDEIRVGNFKDYTWNTGTSVSNVRNVPFFYGTSDGGTGSIGDLYLLHWDGEGESPERFGPIFCQRRNTTIISDSPVYQKTTNTDFQAMGFKFPNNSANNINREMQADRGLLATNNNPTGLGPLANVLEDFEVVGYTLTASATNVETTGSLSFELTLTNDGKVLDNNVTPAQLNDGKLDWGYRFPSTIAVGALESNTDVIEASIVDFKVKR